jgi:hypothetical protein
MHSSQSRSTPAMSRPGSVICTLIEHLRPGVALETHRAIQLLARLQHPCTITPTLHEIISDRTRNTLITQFLDRTNPLGRLYIMYMYFVTCDVISLRAEIRSLCCDPACNVQDMPDPYDPDPARYAILAALTHYLCEAVNNRIQNHLQRDPPTDTSLNEVTEERRRAPVLARVPPWATRIPELTEKMYIPTIRGGIPELEDCCGMLLELGIRAEHPMLYVV